MPDAHVAKSVVCCKAQKPRSGPLAGKINRAAIVDLLKDCKAAGQTPIVKTVAIDVGIDPAQVGRHLHRLERDGKVRLWKRGPFLHAELIP